MRVPLNTGDNAYVLLVGDDKEGLYVAGRLVWSGEELHTEVAMDLVMKHGLPTSFGWTGTDAIEIYGFMPRLKDMGGDF